MIELKSNDLTLLNNKSLGINHQKVHLWKYLSEEKIYTKCIYLESNLLVCFSSMFCFSIDFVMDYFVVFVQTTNRLVERGKK